MHFNGRFCLSNSVDIESTLRIVIFINSKGLNGINGIFKTPLYFLNNSTSFDECFFYLEFAVHDQHIGIFAFADEANAVLQS